MAHAEESAGLVFRIYIHVECDTSHHFPGACPG
jgi:hypothetical protein